MGLMGDPKLTAAAEPTSSLSVSKGTRRFVESVGFRVSDVHSSNFASTRNVVNETHKNNKMHDKTHRHNTRSNI